MTEEEETRGARGCRKVFFPLTAMAMMVLVSAAAGLLLLWELPLRVLFGWAFHAWELFPRLLPRWAELLFPLACLLASVWLAHRFLRWWSATKGRAIAWRPAHSAAVILLLLFGSAAAIAISGIAHQLFWLSQDKLLTNGRATERTVITNHSRQLWSCMEEFRAAKGRLPESMQELESEFAGRLKARIDPGSGRPGEPFLLVAGRGEMPTRRGEIPWILSPRVRNSSQYIMVFESGACAIIYEGEVEKWLRDEAAVQAPQTPAFHE